MKRDEIIKYLETNDSTVLSFKDRGTWGNNRYRGNCSGWIQAFLMWKYKVQKFAELFSGSGTGYDVAKDMGVQYVGADLNPTIVRPGILPVNAITDDVPDEFLGADMLFMHPPYGKEIGIPYAGSMYADPTGELSASDLGQMPWQKFIQTLNEIVMKYYAAMESGSRMAILMGDVRRNGQFHSMLTDICKVGQLEQIIIKTQHNCVSDGRIYSSKSFVPIVHEYLMVMKKIAPLLLQIQMPKNYEVDVRDTKATWRDVICAIIRENGKPMTTTQLYAKIDGHKKSQNNPHYKEKVRQTLHSYPIFVSVSEGMWYLAA